MNLKGLSGGLYAPLSSDQIDTIHDASLTILESIGINGPGWLQDPDWAIPSLVLISLWGIGETMIIYLAGLQGS